MKNPSSSSQYLEVTLKLKVDEGNTHREHSDMEIKFLGAIITHVFKTINSKASKLK